MWRLLCNGIPTNCQPKVGVGVELETDPVMRPSIELENLAMRGADKKIGREFGAN